jgi:hypothetical protein
MPYLDKVFDLHIDGKPVYSADEVDEARSSFGVCGQRSFINKILKKVVALSDDVFKKDPES